MNSIKRNEGFLKGLGEVQLYYQSWLPKNPRGILVVAHGLGEHCGRYQEFAEIFSQKGWGVYLYDYRGHGRSSGRRAHVSQFSDLVKDLEKIIEKIHREAKTEKLFLVAHSFGGQVAINYLANHPKGLSGSILSAPNVKLAMKINPLKRFMASTLSNILPGLSLGNEIQAEYLSHDAKIVRDYKNDKWVSHRLTLRLGAEILSNLDQIMQMAPKIKTPILLLHGTDDKLTSPEGSKEFFKKLKVQDRKLQLYPDYYHEIFKEIGKERVFKDMEKWLEERT